MLDPTQRGVESLVEHGDVIRPAIREAPLGVVPHHDDGAAQVLEKVPKKGTDLRVANVVPMAAKVET
ncbi:MAG: hypothetical protein ACYTFI_27205, partial [Planctomycetota bacterium]